MSKLTSIELQERITKLHDRAEVAKIYGHTAISAECLKVIATYKRRIARMKISEALHER